MWNTTDPYTVEDLTDEIDKGGQTDKILLDFLKAFDKVPHKRLLLKLDSCGITSKTKRISSPTEPSR